MPNFTGHWIISPFGASYRNEEYGAIAIMQDAAADRTCIALSPLNAARAALYNLRSQGWCKPAPEIYRRFSNGVSTTEENIDKKTITDKWGEDLSP